MKLRKFIAATIREYLNENITVTKKEIDEMQKFLEDGGILKNDVVGYHILIRKDGEFVFSVNSNYKFFKNKYDFIKAAVKIYKTGG